MATVTSQLPPILLPVRTQTCRGGKESVSVGEETPKKQEDYYGEFRRVDSSQHGHQSFVVNSHLWMFLC